MAVISKSISDAASHLSKGHLIGIPTETVYGLAGNALDPDVVINIFKVKERPSFDPLIVHTDSIGKAKSFIKAFPEEALRLADHFWPGPLTIVLPKRNIIPDIVTSGLENVAIRIPNHDLTLELLTQLDFPVAAPSANPFGYVSPTSAEHVNEHLGEKIPFILDGGPTRIGIESTIVAFIEGKKKVLRLGGVPLESLERVSGLFEIELNQSSNPQAPGMLEGHYSPKKKLLLGDIKAQLDQYGSENVGILSLNRTYDQVNPEFQIQLSTSGDLNEAAKNLFASMRKFDSMPVDLILAEEVPDTGLGRAINDRLRRAGN